MWSHVKQMIDWLTDWLVDWLIDWLILTMPVYEFVWYDLQPIPFMWKYPSYDDCLEDKRENYQNCSVLFCVGLPQLYQLYAYSYESLIVHTVFGSSVNLICNNQSVIFKLMLMKNAIIYFIQPSDGFIHYCQNKLN